MTQLVIVFFAPSKSGKTTAAKRLKYILQKKYNYTGNITQLSFATIYKEIGTIIGFDTNTKDTVNNDFGIKPREFYRALGDFFRYDLPRRFETWPNKPSFSTCFLIEKIKRISGIVIIDDLRYMEEYEALTNMGAKIAYIWRHNITIDTSHSSETELFDIIKVSRAKRIENNGSITNLDDNIVRWLKEVDIENFILSDEYEQLTLC